MDSAVTTPMMDQDVVNHTVVADYEDSAVYNTPGLADMMWKIREDCESMVAAYNQTNENGGESISQLLSSNYAL